MEIPAPQVSQPQPLLAISNILAFAIMIAANTLSVVLPLNGKSQLQLSAQYDNLFTPAGFTFSVWGVIYLFLAGFVVYAVNALLRQQHRAKVIITAISPLFIGACLCNAAWIFAWHYEQVLLSVGIMLLYLLQLIIIHERLHLALPTKPLQQKLWLDMPFSLNLSWICIATIANIAALCVQNHWGYNSLSQPAWAVTMIIIGTLIALFYVLTRYNLFFAIIIIWALYGIVSKRKENGGEESQSIIWTAYFCIGIIIVAIIVRLFKHNKASPETPLFSQP